MMLSLTNKQSTVVKADLDRKKLLTAIDQDGSLTQQAYADQCSFASQQVVSGHIKWLGKEKYLNGTAKKLKVTKKGKDWCTSEVKK
jgi:predicted transcriptional regulator